VLGVSARQIADLQDVIRVHGKDVLFTPSDGGVARTVRARVLYLSQQELQNSIEQYPIRVHLDPREFPSAPLKGDTLTIDDARRGIMSVHQMQLGNALVAYRCGVAG
jgi:hypothetical protein